MDDTRGAEGEAAVIESWKGMATYVSNALGRDLSAEALRQLAKRDNELSNRIHWISGRPGIARHDLDTWIAMRAIKGRRRKPIRTKSFWLQGWLNLF